MTVSYLPLIKVQQKRHGFPVHDRAFTSSVDLLAAGKAARARLMGIAVAPEPEPAPVVQPVLQAPPPPPEVEEDVLEHYGPLNMLAPCSGKFLLAVAALRHGLSVEEIVGGSRKREHVAARVEAMCLIYQHTQWSLPQVGRFLRRDHTTVLHALQKCGVTRKKVELLPHMANILRPGRKTTELTERQPRDTIVIPQTYGFDSSPDITAGQIIAEVCAAHGISEFELRSARRAEPLVVARREAMYRLAKEAALTNREIGKAMGGKDPSLVHYAIRSHEARLNG